MIIYRYLAREVCSLVIGIAVILLLILLSNQFLHYLRYAAMGRMTAHTVLLVLSLQMPVLLSALLPLSLFLGVLLVYGRMYADNEMTVLFACGFSKAKLIKITMSFALITALIVAVLALWVAPHVNKYSNNLLKQGALSPLELVQSGKFQAIRNGEWVFYVKDLSNDHKIMHNIFAAQQPSINSEQIKHSLGVLAAAEAQQIIDKKGDTFLVFKNGHRYLGAPGEGEYQIVDFSDYGILIQQKQQAGKLKADALSTSELWQKRDNSLAAAELQWRISIPLMVFILALLAVPLAKVNSRQGRYLQILPAMLLYVIYANCMFVARTWVRLNHISHYIGLWWVHIMMLLITLILLAYHLGWRRFFGMVNK